MSGIRGRIAAAADGHVLRLVRGSGFIFACRVTGAVLALTTQWALARWLGPDDLGSYLLAYSWCILVARFSGLGFNSTAARFIGKGIALGDRASIRGFVSFTGRTVVGVSVVAAAVGTAFALIRFAGSDAGPWPLVIAFAAVPIMATSTLLEGFAVAFSWFRAAFVPTVVLRPAVFLAAVGLFWGLGMTTSVSVVMLLQLGSMGVALLVLVGAMGLPLKRDLAGAGTRVEARQWTLTAAALLIISLFRDYLPELSIIVAGIYLAPDEIAVFSIGYKLAALISFVLFAVDAFTIPQVAQAAARDDRADLQAISGRASRLTFAASLAALVCFWLFGRWALGLFGEEFVAGYRLMLIIAVAQVCRAAVGPVLPLLTVAGYERQSLKVFAASLLLVAPLVVVLAPRWGAEGVGTSVAAVIVLSSLALHHRVRHLMGVDPSILSGLRTPEPVGTGD